MQSKESIQDTGYTMQDYHVSGMLHYESGVGHVSYIMNHES